jgi:hypothetical protein
VLERQIGFRAARIRQGEIKDDGIERASQQPRPRFGQSGAFLDQHARKGSLQGCPQAYPNQGMIIDNQDVQPTHSIHPSDAFCENDIRATPARMIISNRMAQYIQRASRRIASALD